MATTDLHVHIRSYDYYADRPDDRVGLERTITLARLARAEADNAVLVDNGDFLQGNPMGDFYGPNARRRDRLAHPAIAAMNAAGYDVACLGNHEFNYGLPFLAQALRDARFPLVAANIEPRSGTEAPGVAPYHLLDRMVIDGAGTPRPLRIGFLGLLPPQIQQWDREALAGRLHAHDMVETAKALVPRMRAEGAEVVVVLCHGGIGAITPPPMSEDSGLGLAQIAGVDAVIAGHTHGVFPGPGFQGRAGVDVGRGTIAGKPAVKPGLWGSHLGIIDLLLRRDVPGWHVAAHESAVRPIAAPGDDPAPEPDPAVRSAVRLHHARTLRHIRRPIGQSVGHHHSFLSLVAPDAALKLVMAAQRAFAEAHLAGRRDADLPLLSAAAPFKAGRPVGPGHFTRVPPGRMTLRSAADLYVFPNTVRIITIDGRQLRGWLEMSACAFNRIVPGAHDQILLDPEFPAYNFDVLDGVTYVIDPSQPPSPDLNDATPQGRGGRIRELCHAGRPVTDGDRFHVVTNSYRVDGGDFPSIAGACQIDMPALSVRDVLVRHIRRKGVVRADLSPIWRFAELHATSAVFDTSPEVVPHLADVPDRRLEPVGLTAEGFMRLRLRF